MTTEMSGQATQVDPITFNNETKVIHETINSKYRIVFEKAASANKIDGFKVEVNGDDLDKIKSEATDLYIWAIIKAEAYKPVIKEK